MFKLSARQTKLVVITSVALYVVILSGLGIWLYLNRDITLQKRALQTPTVTAWLPGKEPKAPDSWADKDATKEAENSATTAKAMPPAQSPQDLEKVTTTDPAPEEKTEEAVAVNETSQPEQPPSVPPAEQQSAVPEEVVTPSAAQDAPAVETVPLQKWQKYARPFDQKDTRPRIGLIVTGLGLMSDVADAAVTGLPADISLAFSSLTPEIEQWVSKARSSGHEVLLAVPMEPKNYPQNDPGPNALLLSLSSEDNVSRLRRAMARADGYVGVIPAMGEKFVTSEKQLAPVLDSIKTDEMMVVDGTMSKDSLIAPLSRLGRVPFARTDARIDAAMSSKTVEEQLQDLEKIAREKGQALALVAPYPAAFTQIKTWAEGLEKKGLVLAPVTALSSQDVPVIPSPVQ